MSTTTPAPGASRARPARFPRSLAAGFWLLLLTATGLVAQDYQKEVDEIARATGLKLKFEETENFIWAYNVPTGGFKPIAKAGEKAFKIWKDISGVTSWKEMWGPSRKGTLKCLVAVLRNKVHYRKFVRWYDKTYQPFQGFRDFASRVSFWPSPTPRVCIMMHSIPISVRHLQNVAAHEVGHMCVMRYKFNNNHTPPWLEEGMGCYLEARTLGRNNCYCFSGGYGDTADMMEKLSDVEFTKWKGIVRGMVRKKSDKRLAQILPLRLTQLTAPEVGKAWSLIDFMVKSDKKKFCLFLRRLRRYWPESYEAEFTDAKRKAQERALRDSFDYTIATLDEAWREWARKGMK